MPQFIVYVKEVWIQAVKIKAQTKKEAIDLGSRWPGRLC